MAYLFPYAGMERPPRPPKPLNQRENLPTHHPRRALKTKPPAPKPEAPAVPSANDAAQVETFSQFIPPTSTGLPPAWCAILQEVCFKHRVPYEKILSPLRDRRTSTARIEFMYRLMEEIPNASYAGVGRRLKRDHTTVLSAHRKGMKTALTPFVPKEQPPRELARRHLIAFTAKQEIIIERLKAGKDYREIAGEFEKNIKWLTNQLYEIRSKIARMDPDKREARGLHENFGRVEGSYNV